MAEQVLVAVIVGGAAATPTDAGYWLLMWVIFKMISLVVYESGARVSAPQAMPGREMSGPEARSRLSTLRQERLPVDLT